MCSSKAPKVRAQPTPKPEDPVAPLVSAAEGDDAELNRKKGLASLKVGPAASSGTSGLNIP